MANCQKTTYQNQIKSDIMTKPKHPAISYSLVILQFTLIILLLLALPLSSNLFTLLLQATAIIIGLWAVKAMHLGKFNIVPDPRDDTELITDGPYRYIRHPMYFSIILFFLPLVLKNFNGLNLAIYINLCIILFIKLSYEEQLLTQHLVGYKDYQKNSKKLLPFIL